MVSQRTLRACFVTLTAIGAATQLLLVQLLTQG